MADREPIPENCVGYATQTSPSAEVSSGKLASPPANARPLKRAERRGWKQLPRAIDFIHEVSEA